jgi:hypothetical protein
VTIRARLSASREGPLVALAVALSAAFIALVCFRPTGTVDVWWTLAVGDYIHAHGEVPRTALWTIEAVRDQPYVCSGWLAAWLFSGVASVLGLDAVPLVPTLIALAVFASLVVLSRQLGASWLLAVVVADLVLYSVALRMICRSEVFAYLYFSLSLNVIAGYLRAPRTRTLAWLVPLAVLWVNSHGSFPVLLGLLLLVIAGLAVDAWRRAGFSRGASLFWRDHAILGAAALAVAAASLVNPYGPELLRSVLEPGRSDSMTRFLDEWRPLWTMGALPPRFLVPAGLVAAALVAGHRRLSTVTFGLALCFSALALSGNRHITFFAIAAAFVLGDFAAGLAPGPRVRSALAVSLVAALLAANVITAATLGLGGRRLSEHPSPYVSEQGLAFLRDHVEGNVLNSYHLGGLLIYFTWPRIRVAIDSRADPYPARYYLAYRAAIYGPPAAARQFVRRYAIDHIVLDRGVYDRHFRPKVAALIDFRPVYQDDLTVVLSREGEAYDGAPASR